MTDKILPLEPVFQAPGGLNKTLYGLLFLLFLATLFKGGIQIWMQFEMFDYRAAHHYHGVARSLELIEQERLYDGYLGLQIINFVLSSFMGLMVLITGVFFLVWMYRVSRNLNAFQLEGIRFSPQWAVGWCLVPFCNLYYPRLVVQEIWKASEPMEEPTNSLAWKSIPGNFRIEVWWRLFLLSLFSMTFLDFGMTAIVMVGAIYPGNEFSLVMDELLMADPIRTFAIVVIPFLIQLFCVSYTLRIVRAIDKRQEEKMNREKIKRMQSLGGTMELMPAPLPVNVSEERLKEV